MFTRGMFFLFYFWVIKPNKKALENDVGWPFELRAFVFSLSRAGSSLCSTKRPKGQVHFDAKPTPYCPVIPLGPSAACLSSVSPTHLCWPSENTVWFPMKARGDSSCLIPQQTALGGKQRGAERGIHVLCGVHKRLFAIKCHWELILITLLGYE